LTVVSSGDPADVLPAFTTYTWSAEHRNVLSSMPKKGKQELKNYLSEEIKYNLSQKGYQYTDNAAQADVVIGFLFALEDAIADRTIQEKFGLLPGLSGTDMTNPRYEKGSFLFAVFDNKDNLIYWRTAAQGFVDLEKDKEDKSSDRFQKILSMMLNGFPRAGH